MSYPYIRLARQCCRLLSTFSKRNPQQITRNTHTTSQLSQKHLKYVHTEWKVLRKRVLDALRSLHRGEKHLFSTTSSSRAGQSRPTPVPGSEATPNPMPLILAIILTFIVYFLVSDDNSVKISWDDFVYHYLKEGKVQKLMVLKADRKVSVILKKGNQRNVFFRIDDIERFEKNMEQVQTDLGIHPSRHIDIQFVSNQYATWFVPVMIAATLAGFTLYMRNSVGSKRIQELRKMVKNMEKSRGGILGGMFARSPATLVTKDTGVTFKDVAGCEEAKIEIMEFVNFLKNPQGYLELGAKIPKGALLNGPPGTGKTLLAKATAGEAGVPFITASGSEFLEMFVGVGIQRIRNMFHMAKENAPCILFIDEIDAIAVSRGQYGDDSKTSDIQVERENTLNQLLVEMDGFETQRGVIVLAATNRVHVLDKALLRPGRFDRQIYVSSPDIKGRASIFKVYLKNLKTEVNREDVARKMAALTPGLSGADIMNICNEAALIAVRNKKDNVEMIHFENALERIVAGMEKKTQLLQPAEKQKIAYHEAGRAVAGWFLEYAKPLLKISIVPRGDSIGHAMYLPREQFLYSKEELMDRMCMDLGGCISHEIFFGNMTTRSQKDLREVTKMAYRTVANYGMSVELGQLSYDKAGPEQISIEKPYSENLAQLIDSEVNKVIHDAYTRTRKLLTKHISEVEKVAAALLEKEKLDKEGLIELLGPRPFVEMTTYEDMVAGTGSLDEDVEIPEGLKNWNKKTKRPEEEES